MYCPDMCVDSRCMAFLITSILALIPCTHSGVNNINTWEGVTNAEIINGDAFFEILEPSELKYTYRIRPARNFGGQFNESFCLKNTKLVPMDPLDGCSALYNEDNVEGNVAFAIRGSCSFLHKTLIAERAGARAIIITELESPGGRQQDTSPDQFIEMIDDKSDGDPSIPAAFLLGRNGGQVLRTLSRLRLPYAIINIPINMTHVPLNKMNQPPWTSW